MFDISLCTISIDDFLNNVCFIYMRRFRNLKDKLINSKRDSQKIDEEDLSGLRGVNKHKKTCSEVTPTLSLITSDHYKISDVSKKSSKRSCNGKENKHTPHQERSLEENQTLKKGRKDRFGEVLQLMQEINALQQKGKGQQNQHLIDQKLADVKGKLAMVKEVISTMEKESHRSILDFYNQDNDQNSPQSFSSQNSDENYQPATERDAYQMGDSRKEEDSDDEVIHLNYRRIDEEDEEQGENSNNTFLEELEETPQPSIVHLYSYSKEKIDSPLSRISERESQYHSPESKKDSKQTESLEFKKIRYLLETTEKKSRKNVEVSSFDESTGGQEGASRHRAHSQLGQMIEWLEKKYQRRVTLDEENWMKLSNAAKQKRIKVRGR